MALHDCLMTLGNTMDIGNTDFFLGWAGLTVVNYGSHILRVRILSLRSQQWLALNGS